MKAPLLPRLCPRGGGGGGGRGFQMTGAHKRAIRRAKSKSAREAIRREGVSCESANKVLSRQKVLSCAVVTCLWRFRRSLLQLSRIARVTQSIPEVSLLADYLPTSVPYVRLNVLFLIRAPFLTSARCL